MLNTRYCPKKRVEFWFNHKPSEAIRSTIKLAGFMWSRRQDLVCEGSSYTNQIALEQVDKREDVGEKLSYAEQVNVLIKQ